MRDQDWAVCVARDGCRDASEKHQLDPAAPVRSHDDDARPLFLRRVDDPLPDRIALLGDRLGLES